MTRSRPSQALTILVVTGLLAGPFVDYLRYYHYPLLAAEVLGLTGVLVLSGIVVGIAVNRLARPARIAALAVLLLFFVDMQFSAKLTVSFKLVPIVVLAAAWLLERHAENILAPMLAVFYLVGLSQTSPDRAATFSQPTLSRDTLLPPVLYIILDQHIGFDGWPQEFAITREMQHRTQQLYLHEGFRTFDRAYSEFYMTTSSIPATLNWPVGDPHPMLRALSEEHFRLKANDMFRTASAAGYRIRVYQSTYIDYCDTRAFKIQSCATRPATSVRNVALLDLPPWAKAVLIGRYFLETNSKAYLRARDLYDRVAARYPEWSVWVRGSRWYTFPGAMELLGQLEADLRADDSRGTLYFAHLLAPHASFIMDEACHTRAASSGGSGDLAARGTGAAAARAMQYEHYAAQVGCLDHRMEGLMHMIDSISGDRRMVVIVHGDHGSRLPLHSPIGGSVPMDSLTPSDLDDLYSSLFAIRGPGFPPGSDKRFLPVNELVGDIVASGFRGVNAPDIEPHVVKVEPWSLGKEAVTNALETYQLSDTALVLARRADGSAIRVPPVPE